MNNLEFLICRNFENWETLFCELINGKIDFLDFESKIYEIKELEEVIDHDLYIQLISLNYKDPNNQFFILNIANEILIKENCYHDWKLCDLFKKAGWKMKNCSGNIQSNAAELIACMYGGLEVGELGKGVEMEKNIISFFTTPDVVDFIEPWYAIIGKVKQVGIAIHGELVLFVDQEGFFYIYVDMTDEMYLGGNFKETMYKLLLGFDYGKMIKKLS